MTELRSAVVLVVAIACISLACSWLTAFAVSNRSDQPISVVYYYRPSGQVFLATPEQKDQGCPLLVSSRPALAEAPSTSWWHSDPRWRDLSSSEFTFDQASCRIEVELEPGHALRVASGSNYTGLNSGRWGDLSGLHLEIRSRRGVVAYSGFELVRQFQKRSDSLYELPYS